MLYIYTLLAYFYENVYKNSTTAVLWAVEYTDCISAKGHNHPPNECLYMTLNNLMAGFH